MSYLLLIAQTFIKFRYLIDQEISEIIQNDKFLLIKNPLSIFYKRII